MSLAPVPSDLIYDSVGFLLWRWECRSKWSPFRFEVGPLWRLRGCEQAGVDRTHGSSTGVSRILGCSRQAWPDLASWPVACIQLNAWSNLGPQSHYTGTALLGGNSDLLVEIMEAYLHSHSLIRNWTEPCFKVMSLLDVALEDVFVAARLVLTVYLSRRLLRLGDKEVGWPYNRQSWIRP
jgi:hypothetical protein